MKKSILRISYTVQCPRDLPQIPARATESEAEKRDRLQLISQQARLCQVINN